jgi:hypothetical protein
VPIRIYLESQGYAKRNSGLYGGDLREECRFDMLGPNRVSRVCYGKPCAEQEQRNDRMSHCGHHLSAHRFHALNCIPDAMVRHVAVSTASDEIH